MNGIPAPAFAAFLVAAFAIGAILMSISDEKFIISDLRAKAIERGAAEWVVDQKTGDTLFKWKEVP